MTIRDGFLGTVGNTPLVRLRSFSEQTGCEILGKAEFLNPGGSVKDRAALQIIREAEEQGLLHPGGTVIEGTAGNTGIGLAHICNARGYRCVIVIPETQSQEKMDLLRTLGADVRPFPPCRTRTPATMSGCPAGSLRKWTTRSGPTSSTNVANRRAHHDTTGPEIWEQTGGKVDGWVAATGTGGTYAGVAMFLKERRKDVRTVLADPMGSGLYRWVKDGEIKAEGSSVTEGIGNGRVTKNLEGAPIDDAIRVDDPTCIATVYELLHEEGLFVGGSSGINVAAAVELAKQMGPGHTIVTVLCDGGARYQSRLFNEAWLQSQGARNAASSIGFGADDAAGHAGQGRSGASVNDADRAAIGRRVPATESLDGSGQLDRGGLQQDATAGAGASCATCATGTALVDEAALALAAVILGGAAGAHPGTVRVAVVGAAPALTAPSAGVALARRAAIATAQPTCSALAGRDDVSRDRDLLRSDKPDGAPAVAALSTIAALPTVDAETAARGALAFAPFPAASTARADEDLGSLARIRVRPRIRVTSRGTGTALSHRTRAEPCPRRCSPNRPRCRSNRLRPRARRLPQRLRSRQGAPRPPRSTSPRPPPCEPARSPRLPTTHPKAESKSLPSPGS